jgi:maltose alpha-D-glucosyltransferase/alpha-amylase
MRRMIALRKQFKAFGRGAIDFLHPENPRVIAYIRRYAEERVLVVANLSRFVQYVELNLAEFKGMSPVELFGRNPFPPIGDLPYLLTLGPHMFLWFSLEPKHTAAAPGLPAYEPTILAMRNSFQGFLNGDSRAALERILTGYLPHCRWFRSKARWIKSTTIADTIALPNFEGDACILLVNVDFTDGESEIYVLPIALALGDHAKEISERSPDLVIAQVSHGSNGNVSPGVLHDASGEPAVALALLDSMDRRRRFKSRTGEIQTTPTSRYRELRGAREEPCEPRVLRGEQSNTSIAFGNHVILKLFRRLDPGVNPDLEVGRFLTEHAFAHSAPVAGSIEYTAGRAAPRTLGILQGFVPNHGDTWEFTLHELGLYFERVAAEPNEKPVLPPGDLVDLIALDGPDKQNLERLGPYLEAASLIGRRVAELHLALISDTHDPEFAPEPYTNLYQRSAYQSMRNLQGAVMRQLDARLAALPKDVRRLAERLPGYQARITDCFQAFLKRRVTAVRMRTHGDLHLGQILNAGKDFFIIDCEGEPALSLPERRRKRSALRDVAGMLRSFSYVVFAARAAQIERGPMTATDMERMAAWARLWQTWSSWAFLKGYTAGAGNAPFMPKSPDEMRVLLNAFQMEKAVYELGYELNNRPDWLRVPLAGIEQLLGIEVHELDDALQSRE